MHYKRRYKKKYKEEEYKLHKFLIPKPVIMAPVTESKPSAELDNITQDPTRRVGGEREGD